MEQSEVSEHEVRVYRALLQADGKWLSNRDVAERADVAPRTARLHTAKLFRLGLLDQAEVFPGHRFRVTPHASNRNRAYYDRLHRAAEVLGIDLSAVPQSPPSGARHARSD